MVPFDPFVVALDVSMPGGHLAVDKGHGSTLPILRAAGDGRGVTMAQILIIGDRVGVGGRRRLQALDGEVQLPEFCQDGIVMSLPVVNVSNPRGEVIAPMIVIAFDAGLGKLDHKEALS